MSLINNIEGKINEAVGKAKQNAEDRSFHKEGVDQEALGKRQQDKKPAAAKPE